MNKRQIRIISQLTRSEAVELYQAGEVRTWRAICKVIQEAARHGIELPLHVLQFYFAIEFCPYTQRHLICHGPVGKTSRS